MRDMWCPVGIDVACVVARDGGTDHSDCYRRISEQIAEELRRVRKART